MKGYLLSIFFGLISIYGNTAPPKDIPLKFLKDFTLNYKIPVTYWYFDDTDLYSKTRIQLPDGSLAAAFLKETINANIEKIHNKRPFYYGQTDLWLYQALEKYPIQGKDVAIIGSATPVYESIVLAYGGKPYTIEYNKILTDDSRLNLMTVKEFKQNPREFDVILSISSIEHDGLGRYGDPLNPVGDLEFMSKAAKKYLKEDGHMFLAVPLGKDCLCWNAHRVYGPLRFPLLVEKWHIIDSFGFEQSDFEKEIGTYGHQPVFYLSPKKTTN